MFSTAAILLGWALQDPANPNPKPQDPPRTDDRGVTTPGSIDAELRAAIDSFKSANSYRFRAEGRVPVQGAGSTLARDTQTPPTPPNTPPTGDKTGDDRVALAKQRGTQEIRVDGIHERGKGTMLTTDQLEAIRTETKFVYRNKGQGEWKVLSDLGAGGKEPARDPTNPPRTDPTNPTDPTRNDPSRPAPIPPTGTERTLSSDGTTAECLARMALPNELLQNLDASVSSCVRQPGGDPKTGMATYECQLKPEAVRKHFEKHGATAAHGADAAMMKDCTLRITVNQGKIDRLVLESGLPLSGKGELGARDPTSPPVNPPANPPTRPASETGSTSAIDTDVVVRYQISDIGKAEVKIPDEAARLLGSR